MTPNRNVSIKDVKYEYTSEAVRCTLILSDGSEISTITESWRSGKTPEEDGFEDTLREKAYARTVSAFDLLHG